LGWLDLLGIGLLDVLSLPVLVCEQVITHRRKKESPTLQAIPTDVLHEGELLG
jgi:hypothetical protein